MTAAKLSPDYLFEASWEVCNKIGGIHTVISTKALTVTKTMGDNYITIGPDLVQEQANPEFEADDSLLSAWREGLYAEGVRVRIGRWRVEGRPIAILIDYKSLISQKDDVLKQMWEDYHVDSISGQWDYIEPVLFGYAAGMVIKSYVENFCTSTQKAVAHFHEWMTASGGLYLRKHSPYVATVFTTHATVTGRCIAGNGLPLYSDLHKFNADEIARRFNVTAKHSIEKMAALYHDAFLTVSEITANECKYLLGREVTGITPNGFENDFVWSDEELAADLYFVDMLVSPKRRSSLANVQENMKDVYEEATQAIEARNFERAAVRILYKFYEMYFYNDVQDDLNAVVVEALKEADGESMEDAAQTLYDALERIMEDDLESDEDEDDDECDEDEETDGEGAAEEVAVAIRKMQGLMRRMMGLGKNTDNE